jgi:hypothetical protein
MVRSVNDIFPWYLGRVKFMERVDGGDLQVTQRIK